MTTYPELMEILSEALTSDVYNQISSWHSERIREINDSNFEYENLLWKIKMLIPKPDEQGGYVSSDLVNLIVKIIEIFNSLGGVWKVQNE